MKRMVLAASAAACLAGCGDDDSSNADAGPDYQFTGEYLDWQSTTATFDGVEDAVWTVIDEPARTARTAPNGRIILTLPGRLVTMSVTQPAYLEARFVAHPAVFSSPGAGFSARGLKAVDAAAFYQSLGLASFDANAAHVLVEKQGGGAALSLTGATSSFVSDGVDDTTWAAGNAGHFVLFTNVPVGGGTATLSASGSFTGPTQLPLEAGKLTITSIR